MKTELFFLTKLLFLLFVAMMFVANMDNSCMDNNCRAQSSSLPGAPFAPSSIDFKQWGPRIPQDSLMPKDHDIRQMESWSRAAFSGQTFLDDSQTVSLQVLRQDYNTMKYNESCMGTPLKLGTTSYSRGLGTHANSEIHVTFPEPVVRFSAVVGIDNNYSTGGVRGSVQFVVIAQGRELLRTPTRRGSDDGLEIDVALPEKTTELTLIVDTTEDGPGWDQSDWCHPIATGISGEKYDLSDAKAPPLNVMIPFSFKYGGISSRELLPNWTYTTKNIDPLNTVHSWTDPATGLTVSAKVRQFTHFSGVDWVLDFENTGSGETPLLEDVKALDLAFDMGIDQEPVVVHTLSGDSCDMYSWLPVEYALKPQESKRITPQGGRSSNGAFPFWNIERRTADNTALSEGVFVALGWSGQWAAEFAHPNDKNVAVTAGMEKIATVLHPGEKIRSPRILLMPWKTDRSSAHVLFRRLLMFEYASKMQDGLPQQMLIVGQCFDRYYRKRDGWEKFDGQVEYAKKLHEAGCDAHWFDAAWFPVGFPNGVGNWFSDPVNFPNGVEALGKVIHDLGMKFVLWFEPERVAPDTQIANEYPQYVFGGKNGGLYKLNDPEAREFLTNLLLTRIKQFGLNVYRNDFNIDPLTYWRENDAPDRRGMTEIRYIEGLYEMWNRLLDENPGLWIDNCASGGRRIDLETIRISVPLWRSDTCCWPGHPEWDQTQMLGLTQYLPLFSGSAWDSTPYVFRSSANLGAIMQFNVLDDDYDLEQARAALMEAKINQKFWYGDFYPLSDAKPVKKEITAWQLHRSDLNAGLVYVFRQEDSPYFGRELQLRAIDPDAVYHVAVKKDYTSGKPMKMTGKELIDLEIFLPEKQSALLIQYEKE